ncbi:hypothetical protein [Arthrobacter bambusae]|uniref:Flagellar basal body-associated protein FliL n=1 Tax=Arthrobacter bambusae TaxID=1338426 RepID=A0AAW8D5Q3_9MICC|nr:hypothetical protein [Arthrobacter bambusae]MDP9903203.1 flagellar basal body-associated protein FliL [Arthrobacter bambusae]MDQ0128803.1 flagellar basal body-associated protein FliL [Arthrobacter bambusae]MDQ0180144.1 flagellar basal body-associated protein FliL [Arthrobacter bambusae]
MNAAKNPKRFQPKPKRSRALWFPVIAGLVALVSAGSMAAQQQQSMIHLDGQQSQITQLERQVTEHSRQVLRTGQSGVALVAGAPSGALDAVQARIERDRSVIGDLLHTTFTWDSHASYVSARKALVSKYGLAEDGTFLKSFLPPSPVATDANGKQYPYIDAAKVNSSLGEFTLNLTSVAGTNYTYLAMVTVDASSNDGSATAGRADVVMLTVSADGKLSSVTGWASPSASRSSATDHTG